MPWWGTVAVCTITFLAGFLPAVILNWPLRRMPK